ncbi:MAG: hypothetical protein NTV58_17910 [Deltaproteobacteria bacterium]|nr:hypothetical protein [Deltaproteobacteria bacterium]
MMYFLEITAFGLYEDDYYHVGSYIGKSFSDIFSHTIECFKGMPQGRPLAFAFPGIVTYLGVNLSDNLIFVYATGAFFCSINAFLLYLILRKWLSMPSAFIGALVFLLNPADTIKILTHANLTLQPSLFCALLGILFYLKQKNWCYIFAYILATMTLLFYESGILIFIFAPFFVKQEKRLLWKRLLIHIIVTVVIIFLILLLRSHGGEDRVSDVITGNKIYLLFKILSAPLIGFLGSLRAMAYGTFKGIQNVFVIEIIPVIFLGVIFIYWLYRWFLENENNITIENYAINIPQKVQLFLNRFSNYLPAKLNLMISKNILSSDCTTYICLVGFTMILSSYLLSFTHYPPTAISGRGTGVHLAATIAWGVFLAGILESILAKKNLHYFKICALSIFGIILMLWSSYAIYLQKGYSTDWEGQKQFWNEVQLLAPDIDENTTLIFDNKIREYSKTSSFGKKIKIIEGASWALPISFNMYYIASTKDVKKPTAHRPLGDIIWKKENGRIYFYHNGLPSWGKWYELDSQNTIMFSMNSKGDLLRIGELVILNNTSPIAFRKSDGINSAIISQTLPYENIGNYYSLNSNKVIYAEPEYTKVKFKKFQQNNNLISYPPRGYLYNFIKTGKFGL